MRKRRRLADKLTIMVCAVLVAVSAFFYAPMDVDASSVFDVNINLERTIPSSSLSYSSPLDFSLERYVIIGDLEPDTIYKIDCDLKLTYSGPQDKYFLRNTAIRLNNNCILYVPAESGYYYSDGLSHTYFEKKNYSFYAKGSELNLCTIHFNTRCFGATVGDVFSIDFSLDNLVYTPLTGEESSSYQQGYNAGYSAGEQVGEDIGYSNGFEEGFEQGESQGYESGFQAGQDSVDTQSYYDAGYSVGYNAGYSSGYEEGYDEGYSKALKAVQGSSLAQGKTISLSPATHVECLGNPFYVSSYGLLDMEEYQSGANGYFYNTVPGTYQGTTVISYNIPFWSLNGNSYPKFSGNSARFNFELLSLVPSLTADTGNGTTIANLMHSKIREVYVTYKGKKYYGNYSTSTSFANFDFLVTDLPNDVNTLINGDMTLSFVVENSVTLVTDSDISHYISAKYTPSVSFMLGRENTNLAMSIIPYTLNDRVSANIQDQTNSLTNGFNDSKGNSVNNDFSAGLNDFETAEDSLFATATTGLKDFTFFDFQSVPAMVTGMSFVGSIMSGWFAQAGGASGVGIVLSILFSIMLVAMVLGLYRWYQSKGGKD